MRVLAFILFFSFLSANEIAIYTKKAEAYYHQNLYSKALLEFKKILSIKEKIYPQNHIKLANTYRDIAICYDKLGKNIEAIRFYIQNIKITQNTVSYMDIAYCYENIGKYKLARDYYNEVLELKGANISPKNRAIIYNNIGENYRAIGRYESALEFYHKSMDIKNTIVDKSLSSNTLSNISGVYSRLGDFNQSLSYAKEALRIREIYNYRLNESYNNIGKIYQRMGRYDEALELYQKSLKENIKGLYKSESYDNIAQIYRLKKSYTKAKEQAFIALKLTQELRGEESIDTAFRYSTLAEIYYDTREYQKAIEYDTKALDIREMFLDDNHIDIQKSYSHLSHSFEALGEYSKALRYSQKAFDIFVSSTKENYLILDSYQKRDYNSLYRAEDIIGHLLDLSYININITPQKAQEILNSALNRWLNFKGNISNQENLISIIYQKMKGFKRDIEKKKRLRVELSTKLQTHHSKKNKKAIEQTKQEIRAIKKEIRAIQINLNRVNLVFKDILRLQDINYEDIAIKLKKNQLYIDFARTKESYFVFTLNAQKEIRLLKISPKDTLKLEEDIRESREINSAVIKRVISIDKLKEKSKTVLNRLYKRLFVDLNISNKESLIISRDGLLNLLPFEALYDAERYLIEKKRIIYIPSAKELMQKIYQKAQNNKSQKVVIFTHPDYDMSLKELNISSSTTRSSSIYGKRYIDISHYLQQLNGSLRELGTMQKIYQDLEVYRDKNATVTNLLAIINPKILHISTHGFYLPKSNENHLQETALALAGANNARFVADTHGIVTALKLSSMELDQTELVVLSACETGLGEIEKAEGVAGLPKAFIQAGARNIMMSLWNVDDAQTANLIGRFYQNIEGSNYTEALRKAKLDMIDMHPYYWSAFIINGI